MKKLFLFVLALAYMPALLCAQEYTVLGREGKAMEAGFSTYNLLKERKAKKEIQAVASENSAKLDKVLQASKKNTDQKKVKLTHKTYKEFLAEEIAKIPAAKKDKWDKMAKNKDYDGLVKEIKSLPKGPDSDKEKYYILTAAVKVNGQNLVSVDSYRIASVIVMTTPSYSYAYKEAEKVKRKISNCGLVF